jgi:hypothetical protein
MITRTLIAEELGSANLAILSIEANKQGKVKRVCEYIDMRAGEVIPADQVRIPVLDMRAKLPARERALDGLRSEVRQFARFVLKFANRRRGITPGIDTLCQWYADLSGKLAKNVRRYVPKLHEAGILAGENLLGPLFQRAGGSVGTSLGEEMHAATTYARLRLRHKPQAPTSDEPFWRHPLPSQGSYWAEAA